MKKFFSFLLFFIAIKTWDFVQKNGIKIYQILYKDYNHFISYANTKAVIEIKKGTPQDYIDYIVQNFADFFIFFERIDEEEIPNGGITMFPPGLFDYKIKFIRHFKPYNTNLQDIEEELLKITEEYSIEIDAIQLNDIVKDDIKDNKIPVLFLEDKINKRNHLGYRFIPYVSKFNKVFKFYHISNHQEMLQKEYKLQKLPALLVFNELEINGQKKIKVAPYLDEMIFSKIEKFLFQIIDIHFEGKDQKIHDQFVFTFSTNLDHKLNFCWNKNCLLIFLDQSKEIERFDKNKLIAQNVKKHFYDEDLAIYLINANCHRKLMIDFKIDPNDLPQVILLDKPNKKFYFYPFDLQVDTLVQFVRKVEKNEIQSHQLEQIKVEINHENCENQNDKMQDL